MASPGSQPGPGAEQHRREADHGTRADLPGEAGVAPAGDADGDAAGFEHAEGLFQRLPAEAIQDHVVVAQDLFEVVALVVDDHVGAEVLDPSGVGRARRRRDVCAEVPGELDRDLPTPPDPAWTRTFWPGCRSARSTSACHAVSATSGSAADSSMVRVAGLSARSSWWIAASSTKVPMVSVPGRA